jgi:hypothetical protein
MSSEDTLDEAGNAPARDEEAVTPMPASSAV